MPSADGLLTKSVDGWPPEAVDDSALPEAFYRYLPPLDSQLASPARY
jgi:hypothetical protein